jgi:hypothetical protein
MFGPGVGVVVVFSHITLCWKRSQQEAAVV